LITKRITASCYDEASAKIWRRHPKARVIQLRYLYSGWWEYTVWMEVT